MRDELLRLENIHKSVSDIKVLEGFRLNLFRGETLGLLGLRNTGKSLIANIIAGLENPDSGTMYFDEEKITHNSQRSSRQRGIFYIYNKLQVIPQLTVAENIFVIRESFLNGVIVNRKAILAETKAILEEVGLDVSPRANVGDLSRAQQHLVELAKALAENAKIIVIDDIVDFYTPMELEILQRVMGRLKKKGVSFLFNSYKPEELTGFADRVIILRNGKNVKTLYENEFDVELMYSLMVGYRFVEPFKVVNDNVGKDVVSLVGVSTKSLRDVSFAVRSGDILGIFDIENKRNVEIGNALVGLDPALSGRVYVEGQQVSIANLEVAVKHGIGVIPKDAIHVSLAPNMSFIDNLVLLIMKKVSNGAMVLNRRMMTFVKNQYMGELKIESKDADTPVGRFDIYTKYRILMQRWLLFRPKVLVVYNPTDNIDLISREIFVEYLDKFVQMGTAIVLISSNLAEVSFLCNRLIILKEQQVVGEFTQENMHNIDMDNFF